MINQQTLEGNWNEIKGKLRSKWGALTDDDLTVFKGNVDQLVGTIQRKTGEARESIEQFFAQFSSDGASEVSRAGEKVRAYAQQAAETVQETSQQAAKSAREAYAEVEAMVRQRPAESLAICLGVGVVTGVVVGLLLRSRYASLLNEDPKNNKEQAVANVMDETLETQAILQRMEEVRCDLDEGVQEIVEGARVMGMWRHYVRTYPWICLGAALAGGYLIVPRVLTGEPDAQAPTRSYSPPKCVARNMVLAFIGNLAMRGVSTYALQLTEKLFAPAAATTQTGDGL